jgi:hypothetical protein
MESPQQRVAANSNGFRVSEASFWAGAFAIGCHRLRPLCSINAPYIVACRGYVEAVGDLSRYAYEIAE